MWAAKKSKIVREKVLYFKYVSIKYIREKTFWEHLEHINNIIDVYKDHLREGIIFEYVSKYIREKTFTGSRTFMIEVCVR